MSLAAGDVAKLSIENLSTLMRVLRWVRGAYCWERLKVHALRIIRGYASKCAAQNPEGAQADKYSLHSRVGFNAQILGSNTLTKAENSGLRKPLEGIVVRWLSIEKGAADLSDILQLLAASIVIAFGDGLPANREALATELLSGGRFEGSDYEHLVRFDPRVRRILTPMTTPYFVLDLWITRLVLEVAWDPLNDASSRLKGASLVNIGGVQSVLRKSIYLLKRMLFVSNRGFDPLYKVAHRGVTETRIKARGLCCLRSFQSRLGYDSEKIRGVFNDFCGPLFNTQQIFETVRKLREVIVLVAEMRESEPGHDESVLIPPGHYRELYKRFRSVYKTPSSKVPEMWQNSRCVRLSCAFWLVR